MNNIQLIKKTLYYIDEHIYEDLTYKHLAEVFGYSPFHFHKIFSSVTELSITEYIRKRRLTMAHRKICETTDTVADICYSVGFNSIQTFNRVFKDTFGMQPLVARKSQAKITYRSVDEIITGYLKRVEVEGGVFSIEPRFEDREEFVIARYRKHTKDGFNVIGEAWFELKSNLNAIERKNKHTMYGFEDYSEEFCSEPLSFYYMAGVEADKEAPLPEGMYRKVVPKAKYAVFTVNGNNANGEIGKAFQYIYFVWLPNSEYCIDENALLDFEYYDERWDCQFGAAQMDIYVPDRRMEDQLWHFVICLKSSSQFGWMRIFIFGNTIRKRMPNLFGKYIVMKRILY